jgi:hypothetical protein
MMIIMLTTTLKEEDKRSLLILLPRPNVPHLISRYSHRHYIMILTQDTHHLPLHDLRGREDDFGIDKNGFCVVRLESAEKTFTDDRRITGIYYKEIDRLLKGKL